MTSSGNIRLVITDGTSENTAWLDVEYKGSNLQEFLPKSPATLNSIWASSPYNDGKQLINKTYDNIIDTFTVVISGNDQDDSILKLRKFIILLEKATKYWTTEYSVHKFWLEARSPCETNIRFAQIIDCAIPEIPNPYEPPFTSVPSAIDEFNINIEHTIWTDSLTIGDSCVKMFTGQAYSADGNSVDRPEIGTDDVYTLDPAGITAISTEMYMGADAGGNGYAIGLRFRSVTVPKNATIIKAWVTLHSVNARAGVTCNIIIKGQDSSLPGAFSTYADFWGRARVIPTVLWNAIPAWAGNTDYNSPSIITIIQAIVNRADWVSGNNLVVFFEDNASSNSAFRDVASLEHATYPEPILYVEYIDAADQIWHGQETPACDRSSGVVPYWIPHHLTHAFTWDQSTGVFGPNLVDTNAINDNLLPAAPAALDRLYCGISDLADANSPAPFNNVVIPVNTTGVNVTLVSALYWDGAAWSALSEVWIPDDMWDAGIGSVLYHFQWILPADWAKTTINGVTGYWMCFEVAAIGGLTTPPVKQATHPIYTISWPQIKMTGEEILGDIPAIMNMLITLAQAYNIDRLMISALKVDRTNSEKFLAFLPLVEQTNWTPYPQDYSLNNGVAGTPQADTLTPAGYSMQFATAGAAAAAQILYADLNLKTYAGRYRVFLMLKSAAGTDAGEAAFFLRIDGITGTYDTPTVYTTNEANTDAVLDLGIVSFSNSVMEETEGATFQLSVYGLATAAIDIDLYYLVFMPVDEMHMELQIDGTSFAVSLDKPWKIINTNPKIGPYGFALNNVSSTPPVPIDWDEPIMREIKVSVLGTFNLDPEEEYWIYFFPYLATYSPGAFRLFVCTTFPVLDKNQRYLLLRGEE